MNMDDFESRIQALIAWFKQGGGRIHPAVEIVHEEGFGFCLKVRHDAHVPAGSTVIACPQQLTLSILDAESIDHLWPEEFKQKLKDSPEVLVRIFIVEQILKGPKSFWWPYINMLPNLLGQHPLTPMYYDEDDSVWIRGTNLDAARVSRLASWKQEYDDAIALISCCDEPRRRQIDLYSWPLYKLAATILTSRCFPGTVFHSREIPTDDRDGKVRREAVERWRAVDPTNCPVLLPVFDLANHNPEAKVLWTWGAKYCTLTVEEDIEGGKEIYNNYGPKSNEELIMGYGFSLPINKSDTFALVLNTTPTDMSSSGAEHSVETPAPRREVFYLRSDTSPEESLFEHNKQLLMALSHMLANHRELKELQSTPSRPTVSTSQLSVGTKRFTLLVFSNLYRILIRKLQNITVHDRDLTHRPLNAKQFHASRYRGSQLAVLDFHISYLASRVEKLFDPENGNSSNAIAGLATILTESPETMRKPFRGAIHHALGTRDAAKIRAAGNEELVFTLWVCSLWLLYSGDGLIRKEKDGLFGLDETSQFQQRLLPWLRWLKQVYGPPPGWPCEGDSGWVSTGKGESQGNEEDEVQRFAEYYLRIVHACAVRDQASIYGDPRWSVGFLRWGCKIVKEEAFVWQGPEGYEGLEQNEFTIFLDGLPEVES